MIKVYLIDDERLFLSGLEQILSRQEGIEVRKCFSTARSFIEDWDQAKERPDVIVVDISIPEVSGVKLTGMIVESDPNVKVIGLSSHYTRVLISKMLKMGASSYLPKNVDIGRLTHTIKRVHQDGFYFDDFQLKGLNKNSLSQKEEQELLYHGLSSRELDVLKLICEQYTTYEIGDKLFISTKTVERHRSSLFEKTKARNVVGLVLFALKHQLVEKEYVE